MNPNFKIRKGWLGGHVITYECPACCVSLKSPIDEAGKSEACPHCQAPFVVPGIEERNRIWAEQADIERQNQVRAELAKLEKRQLCRQADGEVKVPLITDDGKESTQGVAATPANKPIFEYRMVQIPTTVVVPSAHGSEAAEYLQRIVNDHARQGWEFYRVDEFSVHQNPGCLMILFSGLQREVRVYHVITFRRSLS
jgi:hypothetical protein